VRGTLWSSHRLISHADITEGNALSLVKNLWTLSNKHGHVSSKLKVSVHISSGVDVFAVGKYTELHQGKT